MDPETVVALATELAKLAPLELAELANRRALSLSQRGDLFSVAERLLEPEALRRAVARIPWTTLTMCAEGGRLDLATAVRYGFPVWDGEVHPAVSAAITEELSRLPLDPAESEDGDGVDAGTAAHTEEPELEHANVHGEIARTAVRATNAAQALLTALARTPAPRGNSSAVLLSAATKKAAAERLGVEEGPALLDALDTLGAIGPVDNASDHIAPTTLGARIADAEPPASAWCLIAERWLESVTASERADAWALASGDGRLRHSHEAGVTPRDASRRLAAASTLGILPGRMAVQANGVTKKIADGDVNFPAPESVRLVLAGRVREAADLLFRDAPANADRVWLQHDGTMIAPGPLPAALEADLLEFADLTSRGEAPHYRVTLESLRRALLAGVSRSAVLGTLERLVAHEIPQAVTFLIEDAFARAERIVVTPAARTATAPVPQSRLTIADDTTLASLRVDTRLAHLRFAVPERPEGLASDARVLESPIDPATVATALAEAGWLCRPGESSRTARPRPLDAADDSVPEDAVDTAADLIARHRAAAGLASETHTSLVTRYVLGRALRDRAEVIITARAGSAPEDPEVKTFTVVPLDIRARRVRGRDARADVERTIPLDRIVSVTTA